MKMHFAYDVNVLACNPNRGRLTTSKGTRISSKPSDVSCAKCRQIIDRMRPEVVAKMEAENVSRYAPAQ